MQVALISTLYQLISSTHNLDVIAYDISRKLSTEKILSKSDISRALDSTQLRGDLDKILRKYVLAVDCFEGDLHLWWEPKAIYLDDHQFTDANKVPDQIIVTVFSIHIKSLNESSSHNSHKAGINYLD